MLKLSLLCRLGTIDSEIGELTIFVLSGKGELDLSEYLLERFSSSIEDVSPVDYVRALLRFTCYPTTSLDEEGERPDSYILTEAEISQVSDRTLNLVAERFINHEPAILSSGDSDQSSKANSELTPVESLHQMHIDDKKARSRSIEEMKAQLNIATSTFSDSLNSKVASTAIFGQSISERLKNMNCATDHLSEQLRVGSYAAESLRKAGKDIESATTGYRSNFERFNDPILSSGHQYKNLISDMAKAEERKEERRREPFNQLGVKLDTLVDVNAQSVDYMGQMSENQRQFAEETKRSSDHAARNSMWTTVLALISILVACLGVWVGWLSMTNAEAVSDLEESKLQQKAYYEKMLISERSRAEEQLQLEKTKTEQFLQKQQLEFETLQKKFEYQSQKIRELEQNLTTSNN